MPGASQAADRAKSAESAGPALGGAPSGFLFFSRLLLAERRRGAEVFKMLLALRVVLGLLFQGPKIF